MALGAGKSVKRRSIRPIGFFHASRRAWKFQKRFPHRCRLVEIFSSSIWMDSMAIVPFPPPPAHRNFSNLFASREGEESKKKQRIIIPRNSASFLNRGSIRFEPSLSRFAVRKKGKKEKRRGKKKRNKRNYRAVCQQVAKLVSRAFQALRPLF